MENIFTNVDGQRYNTSCLEAVVNYRKNRQLIKKMDDLLCQMVWRDIRSLPKAVIFASNEMMGQDHDSH